MWGHGSIFYGSQGNEDPIFTEKKAISVKVRVTGSKDGGASKRHSVMAAEKKNIRYI